MAYAVMACIVTAYVVMTGSFRNGRHPQQGAYAVMTDVVMAYVVMACIVVAYVVMTGRFQNMALRNDLQSAKIYI